MEDKTENTTDPRREFVADGTENKYYVANPTAEDIRGADWQYSKTYTKCLVEGITTAAEMQDILMRRGIIGPEFEQRANELAIELNDRIIKLDTVTDLDEKRLAAIDVAAAREELFQWNQRLNGPLSNTCEQISDDARLEYLTSCITQDAEGKRVWSSYEDYKQSGDQGLAMKARFEVMLYLQGMDPTFLENTPEARAMREVEEDIIEKAKEAIKAVEAESEEAPKTSTKKRTSRKKKATSKKTN